MSRWKRASLAFASAFLAEALVSVIISLHDHSGLTGIEGVLIGFSIFVVPGCLISLPFILSINRIDGWRLWFLGAVGVSIGPLIIGTWAIVCHVTEGDSIRDFLYMGGLATAIALIATGIYLTALRLSTRKTQTLSS